MKISSGLCLIGLFLSLACFGQDVAPVRSQNTGGLFSVPSQGWTSHGTLKSGGDLQRFRFFQGRPLPAEFSNRGMLVPIHMFSTLPDEPVQTSAPVNKGEDLYIYGKKLSVASTSMVILNSEGQSQVYDENSVLFDPVHNVIRIKVSLEPGIYTVKIPVAGEIVAKTIIVQ